MYYKVLTKIDGVLYSYNTPMWKSKQSPLVKNGAILIYEPGEWRYPVINNSKLFIFKELSDARSMCDGDETVEIWECEVENPEFAEYMKGANFIDYDEFWNTLEYFEKYEVDDGTYYCDAIKLIRRIK